MYPAYSERGKTSSATEAIKHAKQTQQQLLKQKEQAVSNLQEIQKQKEIAIKKAQEDSKKAKKITNNMVQATNDLQETEDKVNQLTDQVTQLQTQATALTAQLQKEAKSFSKFLPLIERLSLYPTDTLLAAPIQSPRSTTGLLVIQSISSQLEKKAQAMRQHKEKLNALKQQLTVQMQELQTLQQQQQEQRDLLAKAAKIARTTQQYSSATAFKISQEAAQAAKKARSINDAIRRINASRAAAERRLQAEERAAERAHDTVKVQAVKKETAILASKNNGLGLSTRSARGGAPVVGSVVTLWGSRTDAGPAQGITYAPKSQATVRSPCSGQVEFSGPFRAYGQMIILNCGKNYRFVLAGMGELTVGIGQNIQKGVMVGKMPSWSDNGKAGRPTLFVQLRKGEKTINPSPFL